jgi:hypothetical protein
MEPGARLGRFLGFRRDSMIAWKPNLMVVCTLCSLPKWPTSGTIRGAARQRITKLKGKARLATIDHLLDYDRSTPLADHRAAGRKPPIGSEVAAVTPPPRFAVIATPVIAIVIATPMISAADTDGKILRQRRRSDHRSCSSQSGRGRYRKQYLPHCAPPGSVPMASRNVISERVKKGFCSWGNCLDAAFRRGTSK